MTTVDKQIFRISQPVCHDDRRIFVAMTSIYSRFTHMEILLVIIVFIVVENVCVIFFNAQTTS